MRAVRLILIGGGIAAGWLALSLTLSAPAAEAATPGPSGSGLAGTGAADVTGVMGAGALALLLGVAATVIGRRFGVGA